MIIACSLTSTHLEPLTRSALISGVSAASSSGVIKLEPVEVSVLYHQHRRPPFASLPPPNTMRLMATTRSVYQMITFRRIRSLAPMHAGEQ
ncbi:hypothetical protein KC368_g96 [Hortaea werneckii]|nr:hypothetical protein KC368_g96 [Hortaea werneckii]